MKMRRVYAVSIAVIAVSALTLSCDVSSSLLSDSERNSLYVFSYNSSADEEIVSGSIIDAGSEIVAAISKLPGAPEPAAVEIALMSDDTGEVAVLRVQTLEFKPFEATKLSIAEGNADIVDEIEDSLPALIVPDSIVAGVYTIVTSVFDAEGALLQKSKMTIFAGTPRPVIESVTSFPPTVEPGAPVLLNLAVAQDVEEGEDSTDVADADWDPWIVWSADGKRFAEGLLSEGLDSTVWQAPRSSPGTYTISAQVYPAAPLHARGFSFRAASRQDLRVMTKTLRGASGDDFADPLSFDCLLRLDGDFSDSGTRPRIAQPEAFGSPRLEVYESGFGYWLDASGGIIVPELMPPVKDGRLGPFSVIVRVAPDFERGDGEIARFASDDDSYSLILGLKDWKPYVEFSFDGKIQLSSASAPVPTSPMTLEAVFRPEGERLDIAWMAEGERIASSSMPLPPAPPKGRAVLGGPGSPAGPGPLAGVYDGFGLSSKDPSPSFRLASRRKWKDKLILAEGFEDGKWPSRSLPSTGAILASGALFLDPGASLSLEPTFDASALVAIETAISGDISSARLDFSSPSGDRVFSIAGTGEILDPEGAELGAVATRQGRISIGISASKDGYLVSSGDSDPVAVSGDQAGLALSLRREGAVDPSEEDMEEGDVEPLMVESVLARRAPTLSAVSK